MLRYHASMLFNGDGWTPIPQCLSKKSHHISLFDYSGDGYPHFSLCVLKGHYLIDG